MDSPVSPDRAAKIRDLFDRAVGLAPGDRVRFLDKSCQGDSALRKEVETLLEGYAKADDVLHELELPFDGAEDAYVGRTISHYDIVSRLGRGGMGVVYKAIDTRLRRTVALKFLPPHHSGHADAKRRLIREARAASSLDHPSICTVYDIDEVDGQLFIVMEFVDGLSLAEKIVQSSFELEEAVRIIIDVAQGLAAAHESGLIHRDIKPANVMLTRKGGVKIMDFGLAKFSTEATLTKSGMAFGTAAYMSPEQARGDQVDHRSDLFSLGVVLYEMITGQRAFKGDFPEAVVFSILNENPEPPAALRPEVPPELDRIVTKCLEKKTENRYQRANDLILDLRALELTRDGLGRSLSGQISAKASTKKSGSRWAPQLVATASRVLRSRFAAGVAIAAAISLAVLSGIFVGRSTAPRPSSKTVYTSLVIPEVRFLDTAISPDGRYLAYCHDRTSGNGHILSLYDFETGVTHEVVRNGRVRVPRFSHDSSLFGFIEGKDLFIGPVDLSSEPVRTFEIGIQYVFWAWARDETILFSRGDLKKIERITRHGRVLPDVTEVNPDAGEVLLWPVNFFPDDRLLMLAEDEDAFMDLYALDLETGERTALPGIDNTFSIYAASGHLLYWPPVEQRLYARALDPVTLQFRGAAADVLEIRNLWFALSDNGRLVHYTDSRPPGFVPKLLSRVDFEGVRTPLPFPQDDYRMIRIDPQSERIGVVRNKRIFVADVSGSTPMQQIADSTARSVPVWSSDSEEMLYSRRYGGSIYSVRSTGVGGSRVRLSGNYLRSLVRPVSDYGRTLRFHDGSSNGELVAVLDIAYDQWAESITVVSLADSATVLQVMHPDGLSTPRFSPDSRFMAYTKKTAPGSQVWVASIDGSIDFPLTVDGGSSPTWSSDLSSLYFVRGPALYELPLRVGETIEAIGPPQEIFRTKYPFIYDVMPDGSGFIVAEATEAPSRILTVIENYFEVLKRRAPVSN